MSQENNEIIKQLIVKSIKSYTDKEVQSNTPLVSSGIIASVDMLEIMLTLEDHGYYCTDVDISSIDSIDDILAAF